ncbi:hypothetical protein EO92_05295 [Methanosarcina sp. 2.H.A.1B.4]|nr:hypothetical protein EO92_05295 [Methanosarcina sp. 2.H.A.1B.4]
MYGDKYARIFYNDIDFSSIVFDLVVNDSVFLEPTQDSGKRSFKFVCEMRRKIKSPYFFLFT